MKILEDFNFENKRVLVRCDFNVPIENGKVIDDFRIKKTLPTINFLKEKKGKIILISHLGDPNGKDKKYTLKPIAKYLSEILGTKVIFLNDCLGKKVESQVKKMKAGQVILLENLRFYPQEKENKIEFSKALSKLADVFVQEGFSVCHRAHASTVGIPSFIPSCAGKLVQKEVESLSKILNNPERPLTAIFGGVKISTKIKVIKKFLNLADHLILGGKVANSILRVKGILVKEPLESEDKETLKRIEEINLTNPKLHLPVDGVIGLKNLEERYLREGGVASLKKEEEIFDIGKETIEIFKKIILNSKMVVFNGPLGYFEKSPFDKGSIEIIKTIVESGAISVAGGGSTVELINKLGFGEKFNHLSTGGGAMLEFLSGEVLPGLKAIGFHF